MCPQRLEWTSEAPLLEIDQHTHTLWSPSERISLQPRFHTACLVNAITECDVRVNKPGHLVTSFFSDPLTDCFCGQRGEERRNWKVLLLANGCLMDVWFLWCCLHFFFFFNFPPRLAFKISATFGKQLLAPWGKQRMLRSFYAVWGSRKEKGWLRRETALIAFLNTQKEENKEVALSTQVGTKQSRDLLPVSLLPDFKAIFSPQHMSWINLFSYSYTAVVF